MSYEQQVANLVKDAINASPYSIKHVSEQTGVPLTTLRRKLSAGSDFTIRELHGISSFLGWKVKDFIPKEHEDADQAA